MRIETIHDGWGSIYHVESINEALGAGTDFWKNEIYTRRLVILRNPPASKAQFWQFCSLFGVTFSLDQYKHMQEHVERIEVDGMSQFIGLMSPRISQRLGSGALYWHADNADLGLPMRALRLAESEDTSDGALSWLNVEYAWQHLGEPIQQRWRGLQVEQQSWYQKGTGFEIFPAVKTHPVTGVESPRANDYCIAGTSRDDRWIHDVLDANGTRLGGIEMKHLLESMEAVPNAVYTHEWLLGDITIYDNQAFLHGRPALRMGSTGQRTLWRCNMNHDTKLDWPLVSHAS
jgi:alpha-ketoglutarate-dependent taurine dioxygenase